MLKTLLSKFADFFRRGTGYSVYKEKVNLKPNVQIANI